jgi:hypothetical protein
MANVHICGVDALPAPFSIAQQWIKIIIVGFPWLHHIHSLTVDQKQPEGISGLRYEGSIEINKINSLKSV